MRIPFLELLCVATAVAFSPSRSAYAQQEAKFHLVYSSGYVAVNAPLSMFVGPSLQLACRDLVDGNLAAAQPLFAAANSKDPGDDGAYVGLLQATGHFDQNELNRLQSVALNTHLPHDQFRMGVYSLYMLGYFYPEDGLHQQQAFHLIADARQGLTSDFRTTNSNLAGFLLGETNMFDGSFVARNSSIYEQIIRNSIGDHNYAQYLLAKDDGWAGALPAVPKLSLGNLRILHRAIGGLNSQNSIRIIRSSGGAAPPLPPYTAEQDAAQRYLTKWADAIASAESAQ